MNKCYDNDTVIVNKQTSDTKKMQYEVHVKRKVTFTRKKVFKKL